MEEPHFMPGRWTERMFTDHDRTFAYDGEQGPAFEQWQSQFRKALRGTLGFPVIQERSIPQLASKQLATVEGYGYRREKWIIQSELGFYLPFYRLLPDEATEPLPVILAVHGHGHTGKEQYVGRVGSQQAHEKNKSGERDIGLQAVRRGYAAIVPDMRGFGELSALADFDSGSHSCRTMQMHAQLFGRTLVGDRVWDVKRLIDYIEASPVLDEQRIAITGNSGGGTVSLFAAAADERINVAVPASYFCTFADSIGSVHHCECNYVPGILQLGEMWDIAGLIAPRPFLAINGRNDEIFPIDATQQAHEKLQRIYGANDARDRCQLHVGRGGHRYYKDPAWSFIGEHL